MHKSLTLILIFMLFGCNGKAVSAPGKPTFLELQSAPGDTLEWLPGILTATLHWGPSSDDYSDVIFYDVFRLEPTVLFLSTTEDTVYTIIRPDSGYYRYGVLARDESGNTSAFAKTDLIYVSYADTTAPSVPGSGTIEFKLSTAYYETSFASFAVNGYPVIIGVNDTSAIERVYADRDSSRLIYSKSNFTGNQNATLLYSIVDSQIVDYKVDLNEGIGGYFFFDTSFRTV